VHRRIVVTQSLNDPHLDYDGERDLLNRICKLPNLNPNPNPNPDTQSLNNPHLDYDGERDLLNRICKLSARAEEMAASSHARLSASKAYFAIVEDRLESLRMGPVPGLQPYYTSVMNRLRPAVRSLDSALMRMDKQVRGVEKHST
jgi:uncharacterized membrane-anchored protein